MAGKAKLDAYYWHEALDRAALVAEIFEEYLQGHPVVQQTPALRKQADQIVAQLNDFYQAIGALEPETAGKRKG